MVRGTLISITFLTLFATRPFMAQMPQRAGQGPGQGAITGVVYDATTNQPMAGAIVILARLDSEQPIPRSVSDSRGRFVFRNLEPSTQYYLEARRFGYEGTRYGWTGPNQSLATSDIAHITLVKDQWVDGIRIPLWRLGSISGRVTDEQGEPLVGVAVRVLSRANISGQQQLVGGGISSTDDLGMYRISGLQPGIYSVAVLSVQSTVLQSAAEMPATLPIGQLLSGGIGTGRGAAVSMPTVDVDGRYRLVLSNFATPPPPDVKHQTRAYPTTFYPGSVAITNAVSVEVGYGDNPTGVDIQVRPMPAVRVSGKLAMPSGEVPPQMLLRLMPVGMERLGFGFEAATTAVDADGSFVFLNVTPGHYSLLAKASVMDFTTAFTLLRLPDAPGFPGGRNGVGTVDGAPGLTYLARHGSPSSVWGQASVVVSDRDVTDVVVAMRRTSTVHGRVVFTDGVSPRQMTVNVEPANGDPSLGQRSGSIDLTQPSYPFTITGLVGGSYLITVSPTSAIRVANITWQGRDARFTGVDASNAEDIRDVVITLTDKKIVITGTVSDSNGPALAAVIAFPVDRSRWTNFGWRPTHLASTGSGSTGAFSLDRLPEGDYYLVAVDRSQLNSWVDGRFLAAAQPFATRVSVKWGDRRTQDLTVAKVVVK